MPQIMKPANLIRSLGARSTRFLSSGADSGGDDTKGSVNVDKLVGFFKRADEKVAREAAERLSKQSEENLAEKTGKNLAIEAAACILETPVSPVLQEHLQSNFSASGSDSVLSGPMKKSVNALRRLGTAPRLVPWTSNRFSKEYRVTRSRVASTSKAKLKSFATLLRESTLVQLGNFNQREVIGVVVENVNDSDLYVDFGGKFLAVVSQPEKSFYPRGSLVRIRLRDPEMANRFMVNTRAISLLEADATLVGPYRGKIISNLDSNSTPPGFQLNKDFLSAEHWKL